MTFGVGYPSLEGMPLENGERIFGALIIFVVVAVAWAYWKD